MTPSEAAEFLSQLDASLDEDVASYRSWLAEHPALTGIDWLHEVTTWLKKKPHGRGYSPFVLTALALRRIVAMFALYRLAELEGQIEREAKPWVPPPPFSFQPPSFLDPATDAARYIVLGTHGDIEHWRRENELPRKKIIAVTSSNDLRGYGPGVYMLVTLASWKPSPELAADVREAIRIMEGAGAVIHR